jgi:putative endonuclease
MNFSSYCVYILECSDGSYYVGCTGNLEQRVRRHNDGNGCLYTSLRRPVRLVFSESQSDLLIARRRERQIKGWCHAKKRALIAQNLRLLHQLAKSREKE